jgi:hypothetical protein
MKQNSLLAALTLTAAALTPLTGARATPLTETTAVQSRPDPAAPVIAYLKAGAEPVPAAEASQAVPDGWMAVEVAGPFEAYVPNRDLTKGLDVKPGSSLYLLPQEGSAVLTTSAKGDKTEITGLHGNWTRIRFEKSLVGYIRSAALPLSVAGGPSPAPVTPAPEVPAGPGRAAPGFGDGNGDASLFPRLLEGQFVSTHNLLPFHKPYAWQLLDDAGVRKAYLDISTLLQTDQIDRYVNRQVEVSGTMTALPNGKDIVVAVQSLTLK